jgi:hypothetical protein
LNGNVIRDAFEQFLLGFLPRPTFGFSPAAHTIGSLQPLERIESILQVSTEPSAFSSNGSHLCRDGRRDDGAARIAGVTESDLAEEDVGAAKVAPCRRE